MIEDILLDEPESEPSVNELLTLRIEAWDIYLKTGYDTFKEIYLIHTDRLLEKGYRLPTLIGQIKIDKEAQKQYAFANNEFLSVLQDEELGENTI